ncbi:MAG: UDP-N-acetylmuramate dehydrogenase [Candidatus Azobacteroides sp.]|nr:UDP-N-acetylmuramate dehydrogenase [Candidatus Azobacteroides sp.]
MQFVENYSLLSHNTFHINVQTARFIEYENIHELKEIVTRKDKYLLDPVLHIGEGSNLLFIKDFPGTILHSTIQYIKVINKTPWYVDVKVGAGVNWDYFVSTCVDNNWVGAENLSLIPGQVGAGAVQNIGAYGVEIKDIILEVETLEIETGKIRIFKKEECRYDYRKSIFKNDLQGKYIVTGILFRLSLKKEFNLSYGALEKEVKKKGEVTLSNIRNAIMEIRNTKLPDPKKIGNAGSFFMNPIVSFKHYHTLKNIYPDIPSYVVDEENFKIPAGWLIEKAGWKGKQIGDAAVHDKQALVLVNKGNAAGEDILFLAKQVMKAVKEKFNIDIFPEVNIL